MTDKQEVENLDGCWPGLEHIQLLLLRVYRSATGEPQEFSCCDGDFLNDTDGKRIAFPFHERGEPDFGRTISRDKPVKSVLEKEYAVAKTVLSRSPVQCRILRNKEVDNFPCDNVQQSSIHYVVIVFQWSVKRG